MFTAGSATFLCPIPAALNTCSIRSLRMNHVDLLNPNLEFHTLLVCMGWLVFIPVFARGSGYVHGAFHLPSDRYKDCEQEAKNVSFWWHRPRKWRSVQNPSMDAGSSCRLGMLCNTGHHARQEDSKGWLTGVPQEIGFQPRQHSNSFAISVTQSFE